MKKSIFKNVLVLITLLIVTSLTACGVANQNAGTDSDSHESAPKPTDTSSSANPVDVETLLAQATADLYAIKNDEARAAIDEVLRIEPDNALALTLRAWSHQRGDDYESSVADVTRALELNPNLGLAHSIKAFNLLWGEENPQTALTIADQGVTMAPNLSYAFNARGVILRELGNLNAAVADFDIAHQLEPGYLSPLINLGSLYVNDLEDGENAIEVLTKALELAQNGGIYYNRGRAYQLVGNFAASIPDLDEAIRLTEIVDVEYWYHAEAYFETGDFSAALKDYDTYIQVEPEDPNGFASRGWTYELLGEYSTALADYEEAIRLETPNAYVYAEASVLIGALNGDSQLADSYFDQALTLEPVEGHADLYNNTAWQIVTIGGNYQNAETYITKALELAPNTDYMLDTQGFVYYELEEYTKAVASFTQAIDLQLSYSYYGRGLSYQALGETDNAITDFQAFLLDFPDDEFSADARQRLEALGSSAP